MLTVFIGLNPGGDPGDAPHKQRVYTPEEHSSNGDYRLANRMREWLEAPPLSLRIEAIPKLNVIFERSKSVSDLDDEDASARRSAPFVTEILDRIRPRAVVFEGVGAYEHFRECQGTRVLCREDHVGKRLRIREIAWRRGNLTVFVLAHPTGSRWSGDAWKEATRIASERLRSLLRE